MGSNYQAWSLEDHLALWLRGWWLVSAAAILGLLAAWVVVPPYTRAQGLVRIGAIARTGQVESVAEVVTRVSFPGFLVELQKKYPDLNKSVRVSAEAQPPMLLLTVTGPDESSVQAALEATIQQLIEQHAPVIDGLQDAARPRLRHIEKRLEAAESELGRFGEPLEDEINRLEYLRRLEDDRSDLSMQLDDRLVRRTQRMGAPVIERITPWRARITAMVVAGMMGLLGAYGWDQRRRNRVSGGPPNPGSPPKTPALLVLILGAALLSGAAAGKTPDWAPVVIAGLLGAFWGHAHPVGLVSVLAVYVPLQAFVGYLLPPSFRYLDEIALLALQAGALFPIFVRRPAALFMDPLVGWAVVFTGWSLFSASLNQVPAGVAVAGIVVTLDYFGLLLVLRTLPLGEDAARRLTFLTALLAIPALIWGLLQKASPEQFVLPWNVLLNEHGMARVPSLFSHPNDFGYTMLGATFLLLGALLARIQDFKQLQAPRHLGYLVALAAALAGMILSVSRSSYLALVVGLVVGLIWLGRRSLKIALPLVLGVALLGGVFAAKGLKSRLDKIEREGGDARWTYLKQSVALFEDHPLAGVGPGRFGGEIAHRYDSPVYERYGIEFKDSWSTVDSFWVHLTGETGLVGIGLFGVLFVILLGRCRRALASGPPPFTQGLLVAAPMLLVAQGFINLSSMALEANNLAGPLWLVLGVGLSAAGDRLRVPG